MKRNVSLHSLNVEIFLYFKKQKKTKQRCYDIRINYDPCSWADHKIKQIFCNKNLTHHLFIPCINITQLQPLPICIRSSSFIQLADFSPLWSYLHVIVVYGDIQGKTVQWLSSFSFEPEMLKLHRLSSGKFVMSSPMGGGRKIRGANPPTIHLISFCFFLAEPSRHHQITWKSGRTYIK